MKCRGGGDADAGSVIGFCRPFENAGNLTELAANLFNHLVSRFGNRVHGHGGKGKGKHTADQKTDDHVGRENVDAGLFELDLVGVGDEQSERGERGGADGKAFAHGGRRIADGVEFIRDLTDVGIQTAHFGNAAGVVSDRTVGVHGNGDAGGREHADGGQRDAV